MNRSIEFRLSVQPLYFEQIRAGCKTVEGRINMPKFDGIKPGDNLVFISGLTQEVIACVVTEINRYSSFEAMLCAQGLENMLPGIADIPQGVRVYEALPEYKERVKIYGVIAIRFERLPDEQK